MSTGLSLYQLRHQRARYDLPAYQEEWSEFWVTETTVSREAVAAIVALAAAVAVLFCMLWWACDLSVELARQAYGVVV